MDETLSQYDKLSFEEKLEVLLPLYLLGKLKEWDFLEPEQEKMLVDNEKVTLYDSGHIKWFSKENTIKFESEKAAQMADVFMAMLIRCFEKALVEKLEYCSLEEWESKNAETKWAVDKLVFYMVFEIKLDELRDKMFNAFSGNVRSGQF